MCCRVKAKSAMNQPESAIFSLVASYPSHTLTTTTNCIYTIVNDKKVNIRITIKRLFKLFKHRSRCIGKIVAIWVLTIHAMNHRIALNIGFKAKRFVSVSMRLHLFHIKGLNLANYNFHRINHFLTKRTVTWQKVDHPHGARFSHVQIKRMLCSSVDAIAYLRVFEIER